MSSKSLTICRVLYVEDTQEDQQILQEAINFTDLPVHLVTATTAAAALQLLGTNSLFDVLLLDWNLPAVTGVEFLAKVRAAQPTVPIMILTGEPRTVDTSAAANLGASTILRKPLLLEEWEQLASRLYSHCDETLTKVTALL